MNEATRNTARESDTAVRIAERRYSADRGCDAAVQLKSLRLFRSRASPCQSCHESACLRASTTQLLSRHLWHCSLPTRTLYHEILKMQPFFAKFANFFLVK